MISKLQSVIDDQTAFQIMLTTALSTLYTNLTLASGMLINEIVGLPYIILTGCVGLNFMVGVVHAIVDDRFTATHALIGKQGKPAAPMRWVLYTIGIITIVLTGLLSHTYLNTNPAAIILVALYSGCALWEVKSVAEHMSVIPPLKTALALVIVWMEKLADQSTKDEIGQVREKKKNE